LYNVEFQALEQCCDQYQQCCEEYQYVFDWFYDGVFPSFFVFSREDTLFYRIYITLLLQIVLL
jgi:hypothetical protein